MYIYLVTKGGHEEVGQVPGRLPAVGQLPVHDLDIRELVKNSNICEHVHLNINSWKPGVIYQDHKYQITQDHQCINLGKPHKKRYFLGTAIKKRFFCGFPY